MTKILIKTILYRILAFGLPFFISFFMPMPFLTSLRFTIIGESASLILYYVYEYVWNKYIEYRQIKKGTHLLRIGDDSNKVNIAYNVIEVLDDNKFIIEVE